MGSSSSLMLCKRARKRSWVGVGLGSVEESRNRLNQLSGLKEGRKKDVAMSYVVVEKRVLVYLRQKNYG